MSQPSDITADPRLDEAIKDDLLQLVSFEIGDEEYAIPILAVQEINRLMPITRVPHTAKAVEGVINLRGRIIPVVNMRQRFGLAPSADTAEARIIVVEVGAESRVIGFTVDRVHEVLRLDGSIVDPTPTAGQVNNSEFIRGVGKLEDRLLILLDLQKLFTPKDFAAANAAAQAA